MFLRWNGNRMCCDSMSTTNCFRLALLPACRAESRGCSITLSSSFWTLQPAEILGDLRINPPFFRKKCWSTTSEFIRADRPGSRVCHLAAESADTSGFRVGGCEVRSLSAYSAYSSRQRGVLGGYMKLPSIVLLILLFSNGKMYAQSDRASITGTVRDSSGAAITDAVVTATNLDTNLQSTTPTNGVGVYSLLNLPIGTYTVACMREGFAKYEHSEINLAINQVAKLDIELNVGAGRESAAVTADANTLQTQTSSISTNLDHRAVEELPLNVQGGRNLSTFMFDYVPSVEGTDFASHIGGGLSRNKEVMIDGTSAVSQIGGYLSESSPPMEAVQEFQVTTAGIRADEGRTGGGVFRYEMKSGSNDWHGSGFFYMHNEAFDARSWSNVYNQGICESSAGGNPAQIASCERAFGKPDDRLYSYGASFGGPIKKDKLFFYAAWERYTFANIGTGGLSSTVPTGDFLNGNFGALLDTSVVLGTDGAGQPIYKGAIVDPETNNVFPGNVIPPERISQVSEKIVDLYKKYYSPLSSTLTNNNALPLFSPATWYESNQYSLKLDYAIARNHRLDGSFIYAY